MDHQRVMLIRARPGSAEAAQALETAAQWARAPQSGLLFFHGPGLGQVASDGRSDFAVVAGSDWDLLVCRAGWRRLGKGPPPEPFAEGSLIQFWAAAAAAAEVRSFGCGASA